MPGAGVFGTRGVKARPSVWAAVAVLVGGLPWAAFAADLAGKPDRGGAERPLGEAELSETVDSAQERSPTGPAGAGIGAVDGPPLAATFGDLLMGTNPARRAGLFPAPLMPRRPPARL